MCTRSNRTPDLQPKYAYIEAKEYEETDPMSKGPPRELYGISFIFSCELVSIPRYDEEVCHVFAYDLSVHTPEGSDRVQDEGESIHTELPELLIIVLIALLQGDDVG